MSPTPIAFVDKVGNVSTHDHSQIRKLLAELPDAPVGEPILALYDATTISQLQAEIARYREALGLSETALRYASFALDGVVALDDEDEGTDGGSATCQHAKRTVDRALKKVRATLGGSNDKE